jgi:hypothetical protein
MCRHNPQKISELNNTVRVVCVFVAPCDEIESCYQQQTATCLTHLTHWARSSGVLMEKLALWRIALQMHRAFHRHRPINAALLITLGLAIIER